MTAPPPRTRCCTSAWTASRGRSTCCWNWRAPRRWTSERISILSLVDQFLAVVEQARRVRLEIAADWLVMAAWLAWLKSRLLLPPEEAGPEEDAEALAVALADRLRELERMRAAAAWLNAREQLGREVFGRGAARVAPRGGPLRHRRRPAGAAPGLRRGPPPRPGPPALHAQAPPPVDGGRRDGAPVPPPRRPAVGRMPSWAVLQGFLPEGLIDPVERRAALASTLVAALETARGGGVELRQDRDFGPILVRPRRAASRPEVPDARAA